MRTKNKHYKIIYDFKNGFQVFKNDKLCFTSHRFASEFENETEARKEIFEMYLKSLKYKVIKQ